MNHASWVNHPGAPGRRRRFVRVLVCDGDTRTALATVRSLVSAGHYVWAAAPGRSLAGVSRGVRALRVPADPLQEPELYARLIAQACERLRIEVLLPVTDASAEALLVHAAALPDEVILPFPDLATFRRGTDKEGMRVLAERCGFRVPRTLLLHSRDALEGLSTAITLPVVIKPHRSVVTGFDGSAQHLEVQIAGDLATLHSYVATLPPAAFPLLLQERIRGDGEGCFALRWNGELLACFAHRRLREKPPAGGISVYRESIALPDALREASARLLEALDWQGVAMIECKRDLRTGRHAFIELNGRLWGSLQLAIDAGVDFPALLVARAIGDDITPWRAPTFKIGIRSQWFWGDIDHLYARWRRSPSELQLGTEAPSRWRTLLDIARTSLLPGTRSEIGRWGDPLPGLLEWSRRLSFSGASRRAAEPPAGPARLRHRPAALDPAPQRTPLPARRD